MSEPTISRPTCSSPRCPNLASPAHRGWCKKHYDDWRKKNPKVGSARVRAHIAELREAGYGWRRIASISGVGETTVWEIGSGRRQFVSAPVAQAILALKPDPTRIHHLNPTGAIRRVRALAALGYTQQRIADEIGCGQGNLWAYVGGTAEWVTPDKHRRICAAFDLLSQHPRPGGWRAEWVRQRAAARGWVPPLAWDENTIDDPDAGPDPDSIPRAPRARVLRAASFVEQYRDIRDHLGITDPARIAERLGISVEALEKHLIRHGSAVDVQDETEIAS